jgi:outer membrane protein assembly factor BamA
VLLISGGTGRSRAAESAKPAQGDSLIAKGFIARTMGRISSLDWVWGGGGAGRGNSFSSPGFDPESEHRNLEQFFGFTIDTIIVSGNTRTKSIALLRELATKQGSVLDERLVKRDSAYLRGLAYFAEVAIAAESAGERRCRLLVTVVERPSLFMRVPYPVMNYDFKRGISYGLTWKIKNFRGYHEDLGVSAIQRTDESRGANFAWNVPWFMGKRVRFRFDAFTYKRLTEPSDQDEEYIRELNGASIGLGIPLRPSLVRQLWLKPSFSFEGRRARLAFADTGTGQTSSALYRQNFFAAGAELEYDSRSDRLSPFDGMLHRFRIRRYMSVAGLEQNYILYGFSDYFYLPVGVERSLIFAIDGDIREGDLPSFYEMRLGGARDLRGFPNEELRGRAKVVGTLQYRMRLVDPHVFKLPKIGYFDVAMNGVVFVDSGTLTDCILDFPEADFHAVGGLGIEILSPLRDLIRLEIASNGSEQPAFYMTAGTDF